MTENDAKRPKVAIVGGGRNEVITLKVQLDLLEELEAYRAIGTVEEIKSFFNENRKAGYTHGYSDGYNNAIDEFAEKVCDRVSEWSERCTFPKGVTCDILTLDCVTDVVFEIAEEMKGGV